MNARGRDRVEAVWVAGPEDLREGDGSLDGGGSEAGPGDGCLASGGEEGVPEVGEDVGLSCQDCLFGEVGQAGGAWEMVFVFWVVGMAADGLLTLERLGRECFLEKGLETFDIAILT